MTKVQNKSMFFNILKLKRHLVTAKPKWSKGGWNIWSCYILDLLHFHSCILSLLQSAFHSVKQFINKKISTTYRVSMEIQDLFFIPCFKSDLILIFWDSVFHHLRTWTCGKKDLVLPPHSLLLSTTFTPSHLLKTSENPQKSSSILGALCGNGLDGKLYLTISHNSWSQLLSAVESMGWSKCRSKLSQEKIARFWLANVSS